MASKQQNLKDYAGTLNISILNLEDYKNKDSVLYCTCKNGHHLEGTAEELIKNNFECIECLSLAERNITDSVPFFLALDAATYVSGISVLNKKGQLLGHKTLSIDKKKDYFERLAIIVNEITSIVKKLNIQCIILEDIQYQQNPILFKKLAMLQGVIRFLAINILHVELITAMAEEWRAYNYIKGNKRAEQKKAAIDKAKSIYKVDIPEDESESIFLGKYGVYLYYRNREKVEEENGSSD